MVNEVISYYPEPVTLVVDGTVRFKTALGTVKCQLAGQTQNGPVYPPSGADERDPPLAILSYQGQTGQTVSYYAVAQDTVFATGVTSDPPYPRVFIPFRLSVVEQSPWEILDESEWFQPEYDYAQGVIVHRLMWFSGPELDSPGLDADGYPLPAVGQTVLGHLFIAFPRTALASPPPSPMDGSTAGGTTVVGNLKVAVRNRLVADRTGMRIDFNGLP